MVPKVQAMTEIKDKMDFIKIKNIYVINNSIKKMKIHPIKWWKIFENKILIKPCIQNT